MRPISKIFNKFAGREVPMKEEWKTIEYMHIANSVLEVSLADPNDPVIAEMQQEAKNNNLELRVLWPGLMTTADYNPHRVTAYLQKESDGKWRIGSHFKIG